MKFDYSAFDLDQIISVVQKNNVSISFEKIENLQQTLEEMLPMMINVKARSKKYFTPLARMVKRNCENGKILSFSNYNSYSDAGIMFDEKNRKDMENILQFLNAYSSLHEMYFFDISNVFGTCIDFNQKHIMYSEYNINYIPLKIFNYQEIQKFVSYMPLLEKLKIDDIKLSNLGITNFVVDVDGSPKKLEFVISKKDILNLKIFDDYENIEEINNLILNDECAEDCKIGFYFVGKEQNKVSLSLNIFDTNILKYKLNFDHTVTNVLYEICWENGKILDTNISNLETAVDEGLTDP